MRIMRNEENEFFIRIADKIEIIVAEPYDFTEQENILRLDINSTYTKMRMFLEGLSCCVLNAYKEEKIEKKQYISTQKILDFLDSISGIFSLAKGVIRIFDSSPETKINEDFSLTDILKLKEIIEILYNDGKYEFDSKAELESFYITLLVELDRIYAFAADDIPESIERILENIFSEKAVDFLISILSRKNIDKNIFDALEGYVKNANTFQGHEFLDIKGGGCFCIATLNDCKYIAVSGNFEEATSNTKKENDAQEVIRALFGNNTVKRCKLNDNLLIPSQITELAKIKQLNCVPHMYWQYIRYGDIPQRKTIYGGAFCAERKFLAEIFGNVIENFTDFFIDALIHCRGTRNANNLIFYSKYEPCNLCMPLLGNFTFYSVKYKGKIGESPYKIEFYEDYCKHISPSKI